MKKETLYSADGANTECLSATSVSEAIIDVVDQWTSPPTANDFIEVTEWKRAELPSAQHIAEVLIEMVSEMLDEEYADPYGNYESIDYASVRNEARAFAEAVRKNYTPWVCNRVKTWTERVADHVPDDWIKEAS